MQLREVSWHQYSAAIREALVSAANGGVLAPAIREALVSAAKGGVLVSIVRPSGRHWCVQLREVSWHQYSAAIREALVSAAKGGVLASV